MVTQMGFVHVNTIPHFPLTFFLTELGQGQGLRCVLPSFLHPKEFIPLFYYYLPVCFVGRSRVY